MFMIFRGKTSLSPSDAASVSHRSRPGLLKKIPAWGLLFLFGLLLGTFMFFPTQIFWERGFREADQRVPEMRMSRESLLDSGWTGVRMQGVKISHADSTYVLPVVRARLGLSPLIRIEVDTGPEMVLGVKRGREVFLKGEADLSQMIPDRDVEGLIRADVLAVFDSWGQPPAMGRAELESSSPLALSRDLRLDGFFLEAALREEQLEILQLEFKEPAELECTGSVALNWSSPLESTYRVQGNISLGGGSTPFEQQGRIKDLVPSGWQ